MTSLLDPIKVGSIELKNRIVMPPMATNYADAKGGVTDKLLGHYANRSKDLGLLIVEHSFVIKQGRVSLTQLGVDSDDLIPGLSRLAEVVHGNGTPIALQINHGGGAINSEITGYQPVAPSSVMHPTRGVEEPKELDFDEIEDIIDYFIYAARRAKEAGFDAVEVHGAHGYLLGQFVSPLTNNRQDEFGGRLVNRVRLSCRIIEKVKHALGSDYPVFYRLGADDLVPGGLTLEEGVEAARIISEKGVDLMDVSGGLIGGRPEGLEGPGFFVPHAAAVKKVLDIPVIGVGGIQTPEEAEIIIKSEQVDLVAIGRAILTEPKWATKTKLEIKGR